MFNTYNYEYPDFNILMGKTIEYVEGLEKGSDEVVIKTADGSVFKVSHEPDCCETVYLEDFDGEPDDLKGALVISSEMVEGETPNGFNFDYEPESYTWTFVKIETNKGGVWMRWLGESNGYYSETPRFCKVK